MKLQVITERYIQCPECGAKISTFDHMDGAGEVGPWYCDECGTGVIFTVKDGEPVDCKIADNKYTKTLVLLRLYENVGGNRPLYLVIEGESLGEIDSSHNDYLYDEHQCPWNYLRKSVMLGDDDDPHGLFQHQETVVRPKDWDGEMPHGDWDKIFPSLRENPVIGG